MPRSTLLAALAAGLLLLLSTIHLVLTLETKGIHDGDSQRPIASMWRGLYGEEPSRSSTRQGNGDKYLVGVGKADITGPVVEINFMGYADPAQQGTGVRQRLYSRAFIVGDMDKPTDRVVYLVLDTQSGDTAVRHGILQALAHLGDEYAVYGQSTLR